MALRTMVVLFMQGCSAIVVLFLTWAALQAGFTAVQKTGHLKEGTTKVLAAELDTDFSVLGTCE